MVSSRARLGPALAVIALAGSGLLASFQPTSPPDRGLSGFERLIRGNERFGRKRLQGVHANAPRQNVVVRAFAGHSHPDGHPAVGGAIYGGVMGGVPQPFSMKPNRPFIFFVRESYSNALLFSGVVMDPSIR